MAFLPADRDRPRAPRSITVGIPVRNGASIIGQQLEALLVQECSIPWDLLVVDNGSTDGTSEVVESYKERIPALRVIFEATPGICSARNALLREAKGDLLALCDADDIVQPGWLEALVQAAPKADQVGGYCDARLGSSERALGWRGTLSETELPRAVGGTPFAPGGNSVVWVDSARAIGGWDECFRAGADDVDFSLRLIAAGGTIAFEPKAVIAYSYRDGLRALMKQFFHFGRTEVLVVRAHPEMGIKSASLASLFGVWWPLIRGARSLLMPEPQRGRWLREVALRAGRLHGSWRARFLLP